MILVDDVGGVFPSINHSPWFGVTLADFVMPYFLFGVGVSVGLVFKKVPNRVDATKKVLLRTIKLFVLGVLLQGGYFHGSHDLTYGVNVRKIRWLGMLQRISLGYLFASMSEIWLVDNSAVESIMAFVKKYHFQWMVALIVCAVYMCLLYGLFVPDWTFERQCVTPSYNCSYTQTVHCGVRGSLDPPCNAVGFVDRVLLGLEHMYQHPLYIITEQCSVNSPDYGPLPPKAPYWCLAPFDPEGILSSLMVAITSFIGLHFGHVLLHVKV
ncbi:unnamed protein product [Linum tenue]|uniref:Heparan-alpha-glucosaminide N-acetyltransferase catalytic domain-containing protein n=2 Tax=Linum tenue TaxID=586396 RepID=A0AAV0H3J7_9ROSI|nr:unnamed protein product [Linum tenue]